VISIVERADVLRTGELVMHASSPSVRDAVHIAVRERHGVETIMSVDAGFDRWPGLRRLHRP
jgi:predicted nucleic acid-binding protein